MIDVSSLNLGQPLIRYCMFDDNAGWAAEELISGFQSQFNGNPNQYQSRTSLEEVQPGTRVLVEMSLGEGGTYGTCRPCVFGVNGTLQSEPGTHFEIITAANGQLVGVRDGPITVTDEGSDIPVKMIQAWPIRED